MKSWRLIPPQRTEQLRYRDLLVKSWRDSGGEPDAALELPRHLAAAGLELVAIRPIVEIITADDPWWHWPASFIAINAIRLHELGYCNAEEADSFATMLDRAPARHAHAHPDRRAKSSRSSATVGNCLARP